LYKTNFDSGRDAMDAFLRGSSNSDTPRVAICFAAAAPLTLNGFAYDLLPLRRKLNREVRQAMSKRKHLRYGQSFEAIMAEFSTAQIVKILKHCRKLIKQWEMDGGCRLMRMAFSKFDYDFLLELNLDDECVLSVVGLPDPGSPVKRMRAARRRREKAMGGASKTLPARTRPPRKAVMERSGWVTHSFVSYKIIARQMRALFREIVENDWGWAAQEVYRLARMLLWRLESFMLESPACAIAAVAKRFVEDSQRSVARSQVSRLEMALVGLDVGLPMLLPVLERKAQPHEPSKAESELLR
jgi:hypothetical protein